MLQPTVLKYFAEVARTGSLRLAADEQDIAPSALSRQISQLERFLDAKLFKRTTKGMQLTAVGRELHLFVEENTRSLDSLLQRIEDIDELRHGAVQIAAIEGSTTSFLPNVLTRFSKKYPGIRFDVCICGSNDVAHRVGRGDSEIGLAFNCPSRDDVSLHARIPQPLLLVGNPKHSELKKGPQALSQLSEAKFALPNRRFGIRRLVDQALQASQTKLEIAFESDSLHLIKQIVSQTDMLTCLPSIVFDREASSDVLGSCPLEDRLCLSATIDVITPHGRALSGAARRFVSFLVQAAEQRSRSHV